MAFVSAAFLALSCGRLDDDAPSSSGTEPRWIAVQGEGLKVVRFSGQEQSTMTLSDGKNVQGTWSPDGRRLVFTTEALFPARQVASAPDWVVVNVAGGRPVLPPRFLGSDRLVSFDAETSDALMFEDLAEHSAYSFDEGMQLIADLDRSVVLKGKDVLLWLRERGEALQIPLEGEASPKMMFAEADAEVGLVVGTPGEDSVSLETPPGVRHLRIDRHPDCEAPESRDCLPTLATAWSMSEGRAVLLLRWTQLASAPSLLLPLDLEHSAEPRRVSVDEAPHLAFSTRDRVRVVHNSGEQTLWMFALSDAGWSLEQLLVEGSQLVRTDVVSGPEQFTGSLPTPDGRYLLLFSSPEGPAVATIALQVGQPQMREFASPPGAVVLGPRHGIAFFEGNLASSVCAPCRYTALSEIGAESSMKLQGSVETPGPGRLSWAPDESGLFLWSEGNVTFHSFISGEAPLHLTEMEDPRDLLVPPSW